MTDLSPEHVSLRSYAWRIALAFRDRPIAVLMSLACGAMFILHVRGLMKVDGYAIALLALAVLPWSLTAFGKVAGVIGAALAHANIRSLEIWGVKVEQMERKIDEHEQVLAEQRRIIDDLVVYSMAFYIYEKLQYIYLGKQWIYHPSEVNEHDFRYLRDHGYLDHFYIHDLKDGDDVSQKLKLTDMGKRFVELKESKAKAVGKA
jgi:hypothetical protein